jgi:DNA-binding NarL/FixJ family response regulator
MVGPDANAALEDTKRRSRLVLADDYAGVLDEIGQLLAAEFDVLFTVSEGTDLIRAVDKLKPDAVISDLQMPGMDGIEAGRYILRNGLCDAVIILTMYNEPHLVRKALEAGIRGYVLKVDAGDELIAAVHAVLSGDSYLSRGVLDTGRK